MRRDGSDILGSLHQRAAAPPTRRRVITQLLKPVNPPAGNNFTRSVPGDYWERMLTLAFTLTCSSTSAARTVALNLLDGDGYIFNQTQIAFGIPLNSVVSQYGDLQQVGNIQGGTGYTAEGSVTTPAANGTIASLTGLPAGTYQVNAVVNMAGTLVQAVDANNIKLWNGGLTLYDNLDNNIGSAPQAFGPFEIEIPAGGSIIAAAINLGTTGSIYSVALSATPLIQQGSFQFPDLTLEPGWQVQIAVGNIQAGDQLSGISLLVERYSSNFANGGMRDEQERWLRATLSEAASGEWG